MGSPGDQSLAVELRNLNKAYGACVSNRDVSLRVRRGSIHALIGENGAGKSTALKMLFGLVKPDSGEILVDGVARRWRNPQDAVACGLGMVQQHFALSRVHSALDNVALEVSATRGLLASLLKPLDRQKLRAELEEVARAHRFEVDWDRPCGELPVSMQQRVEILKALRRRARVLILDEPTAVLTPAEVASFFAVLREMRDQGITILLITHKLREVMALADEVTVMRLGQVVGSRAVAQTNEAELAELMVGSHLNLTREGARAVPPSEEVLLEAQQLTLSRAGRKVLSHLNFRVRPGEIVGIAGVQGNGQSELIRLVLDPGEWLRQHASLRGELRVLSWTSKNGYAPRGRDPRLAYVPEDRHHEAVLLDASLEQNFLLGLERFEAFSKGGWLRLSRLKQRAAQAIRDFDVRGAGSARRVRDLSGGNQQKWVLARELERSPRLLVASEPTRGVDLAAVAALHAKIRAARDRGCGVLLVSSDLDEILSLSDRVLVFFEGRITADFVRGQIDERRLGEAMGGAH